VICVNTIHLTADQARALGGCVFELADVIDPPRHDERANALASSV
jgi:hypothetical protein